MLYENEMKYIMSASALENVKYLPKFNEIDKLRHMLSD
jgi:hypothetical protein